MSKRGIIRAVRLATADAASSPPAAAPVTTASLNAFVAPTRAKNPSKTTRAKNPSKRWKTVPSVTTPQKSKRGKSRADAVARSAPAAEPVPSSSENAFVAPTKAKNPSKRRKNLKSVTTSKKAKRKPGKSQPVADAVASSAAEAEPGRSASENAIVASNKAKNPSKRRKTTPSTPKKSKPPPPRTQSFDAVTADCFPNLPEVPVHTLILGTHPSISSLTQHQYYGNPMNAFWWIAGDCLGFRRALGVSESTGKAYKFALSLRHDNIIPYNKQLEIFCSKGFALWDVVQSCERLGSQDVNVTRDQPNDIPGFCRHHPSVRRIVLANGASGSKFFQKHFRDWLKTGEAVLCKKGTDSVPEAPIVVLPALAVSPAAAIYSYEEKRDFWEQHVYQPGLKDYHNNLLLHSI